MKHHKSGHISMLMMSLGTLLIVALSGGSTVTAQQTSGEALEQIIFYITTSYVHEDAGTDDDISISINIPGLGIRTHNPSNLPWDENERGRTERYVYYMPTQGNMASSRTINPNDICIRIHGGDAWIIQEVLVVGVTFSGDYEMLSHSTFNKVFFQGSPVQESERPLWLSTDRSDRDSFPGLTLGHARC